MANKPKRSRKASKERTAAETQAATVMLFYLDTAVLPPERRYRCRAGKNVGPTQTNGFTLATAGRP